MLANVCKGIKGERYYALVSKKDFKVSLLLRVKANDALLFNRMYKPLKKFDDITIKEAIKASGWESKIISDNKMNLLIK